MSSICHNLWNLFHCFKRTACEEADFRGEMVFNAFQDTVENLYREIEVRRDYKNDKYTWKIESLEAFVLFEVFLSSTVKSRSDSPRSSSSSSGS